jgi:hypothetical protein
MLKKWIGVALLAGWLGHGTAAQAQYLPGPVGAARMPDPLPCPSPASVPNLVPGPLSPQDAPKGPGDDLSLPGNIDNAFPCDHCPLEDHYYFHIGSQGLRRQNPGHQLVVFRDAINTDRGLDLGDAPLFQNIVPVEDLHSLNPRMNFGVKATIGCLMEEKGCAFELSGFYIPRQTRTVGVDHAGQLDLFFFNPPLGFEGDNGMWLQADRVRTSLATTISGAEFNFRTFDKAFGGCIEPIFGVRYINLHENFSIFTDDDGLTFVNAFGQPDPTRQATYATSVNTNIVAPQIGVELYRSFLKDIFAIGLYAKAAPGVSFNNISVKLTRGDGFVGIADSRNRTTFSQIYEIGGYLDIYLLPERMRVRAGYTGMWLVDIPLATDQLSFDLSQTQGSQKNVGNVFFHGPSLEFQFLF